MPENENDAVAPVEPVEAVWPKSTCCPAKLQLPVYFRLASWSSTMKVLFMKKRERKKRII